MSRTYEIVAPGYGEDWYKGVFLATSRPTSRIESLFRSSITQGQVDIYDGFRYPTPYVMNYTHDNRPYGTWDRPDPDGLGRDYQHRYALGQYCNFSSMPYRVLPEVHPSASNESLIKALTKLKDQKVNLAVALAEAQSVADMIATNANRIVKGLTELRKRRWRNAFRAIRHTPRKGWDKELASRILEFQYGVRPLVSDIYSSMEALANARYGPQRLGPAFKVQGSVTSGGRDTPAKAWVFDDGARLPLQGSTVERWEVKTILWFSPKNSLLKTASEVGMINPLAVAWELLPFSCIIDWAYPVSDWLNTLDAATGVEFRGGTTTTWRETRSSYFGYKTESNGRSAIQGSYEQRAMNRVVHYTLPYPTPPVLKSPVSLEHALNALALLTSFR